MPLDQMRITKVDLPGKHFDVFSLKAACSLKTAATKQVQNAWVTSGGNFPFNLLYQGSIVSCLDIWALHDVLIGSFRLLFAHTRNAGCRVPVNDFSHQKLADPQFHLGIGPARAQEPRLKSPSLPPSLAHSWECHRRHLPGSVAWLCYRSLAPNSRAIPINILFLS